ncbi:MAG TPA: hypothetical protein DCM49_02665 [Lachnospiraceae bacterium]|nr:hypothetical protein [Lachnospiraceae bacterium]
MIEPKKNKNEDRKIHVKDIYGGYEEEKRESASGYQLAVSGMKGVIRVLIYICIFVTMVFIAKEAYAIGYNVFNQVSVDTGEGREINVSIEPDMSVMEIGQMLQDQGLIEEEPRVFWIQEFLSDYHGEIQPGYYTLKTGMTPDEMIKSMVETAAERAEQQNSAVVPEGSPEAAGEGEAGAAQEAPAENNENTEDTANEGN